MKKHDDLSGRSSRIIRPIPFGIRKYSKGDHLIDIDYCYARVVRDNNETDNALSYYEKYASREEVVINEEMHYRIMLQQTQYEMEVQERKIDNQKKILIVIVAGLCLCSIDIVCLLGKHINLLKDNFTICSKVTTMLHLREDIKPMD